MCPCVYVRICSCIWYISSCVYICVPVWHMCMVYVFMCAGIHVWWMCSCMCTCVWASEPIAFHRSFWDWQGWMSSEPQGSSCSASPALALQIRARCLLPSGPRGSSSSVADFNCIPWIILIWVGRTNAHSCPRLSRRCLLPVLPHFLPLVCFCFVYFSDRLTI